MKPKIKSFMCPPPGGAFFLEVGGDRISAPDWFRMRPAARDLLRRHNDPRSPEDAVAESMCPHMPAWYCTSGGIRPAYTVVEARDNARPYFKMQLTTSDEMIRRLAICRDCPRHSRKFCLTCSGLRNWLLAGFGNRRPALPDDSLSGICLAAKTFELALTSVSGELPKWDDVPETCWRNQK